MKEKAIVAMSGGVDSSVAAYLLKAEGYDCVGVTLKLHSERDELNVGSTCCSEADIRDAQAVSQSLGMEHYVHNFSGEFREKVIDHFANSYINGDTPNPCIECNRHIKFKQLFSHGDETGIKYVSTGHYARIAFDNGSGRWLLKKGIDITKDQSYVLYSLSQSQLARTLFPVGEISKEKVRQIAQETGLINYQKPDSQDICFVPDGDYAQFISKNYNYPALPGAFTDKDGKVLGEHKGLINYTTGQRKGLGVSADRPLYVIRKSIENNTVILGDDSDLYSTRLIARDVNLIAISELKSPMKAEAKIRYSQKTAAATLFPLEAGAVLVEFDEPQRAITAGQAVVFYDGDVVIGGGTIANN